jgi:outer membrane protein OmpA-like peptidoglycan-associated protein
METPSLLKDTFFSIIVNSSEKLGNSVENGEISLTELNRMIDSGTKTPPAFSHDMALISMSHTVSISQISSLFIKHTAAYTPTIPLERTPTRAYTGILIDARGALPVHGEYTSEPLVPCLFPRIWSGDMDLLYEKNMVQPDTARQRGIIRYSASLDESEYRNWIGSDPLRITAREIFGQNRTDPVISPTDYLRILCNEANRKLLFEGKVVIICNPDQLEANPLGPVRDERYYFTRQEIGKAIARKSASAISLTDSWEGLKLTIYDIRFQADTDRILADEKNRLDVIAEALAQAGPDVRFMIAGHTASVGKPSGELELSVRRARVIAAELARRGISADRIDSTGYGGANPVASNETDEGRAKNRRVEITILPSGTDGKPESVQRMN